MWNQKTYVIVNDYFVVSPFDTKFETNIVKEQDLCILLS